VVARIGCLVAILLGSYVRQALSICQYVRCVPHSRIDHPSPSVRYRDAELFGFVTAVQWLQVLIVNLSHDRDKLCRRDAAMIIAQICLLRGCGRARARVRVLSFLPHSQADRYFRRTKHGWSSRVAQSARTSTQIHPCGPPQRPYVVFTWLDSTASTASMPDLIPRATSQCRALGTQPLSSLHHHAHFICLWILSQMYWSSDTQSPPVGTMSLPGPTGPSIVAP
jgi:hypothetical protein